MIRTTKAQDCGKNCRDYPAEHFSMLGSRFSCRECDAVTSALRPATGRSRTGQPTWVFDLPGNVELDAERRGRVAAHARQRRRGSFVAPLSAMPAPTLADLAAANALVARAVSATTAPALAPAATDETMLSASGSRTSLQRRTLVRFKIPEAPAQPESKHVALPTFTAVIPHHHLKRKRKRGDDDDDCTAARVDNMALPVMSATVAKDVAHLTSETTEPAKKRARKVRVIKENPELHNLDRAALDTLRAFEKIRLRAEFEEASRGRRGGSVSFGYAMSGSECC